MHAHHLYPLALLGVFVCTWAALPPAAVASPVIPSGEGRTLRRQNEIQVDRSQLQSCFNEAVSTDNIDWDADVDVAQSEPQRDDLQKLPKFLSVDAEATQLSGPDPSIVVRHSQAVFQRCLQDQLTDQRAPPL